MTQPFEAEREIQVLLVEDDPGDVLMTREAFEDYKVHNELHVVNDGEQAMAEYQAERRAIIEKTARLRALRLARDAAHPRSGKGTAPTRALPAKTKTKKRVASPAA